MVAHVHTDRRMAINARLRRATRIDPQRMRVERAAFEREIRRRMKALLKAIRYTIVEQNDYALGEPRLGLQFNREAYRFQTDQAKLDTFSTWLQGQIDANLLTIGKGETPWTAKFIDSAYRKGAVRAWTDAHAGAAALRDVPGYSALRGDFLRSAFSGPEMASKVQFLATRSFNRMEGLTDTMRTQLNTILADGIAQGLGPREVGRRMAKEIEGLTRKRAMVIARTEMAAAHAEGQLDSFEQLGMEELSIQAEILTAGDERVCPQCESLAMGGPYPIEEARGMIPVHPNCRCAWIPADTGPKKKDKKDEKKGGGGEDERVLPPPPPPPLPPLPPVVPPPPAVVVPKPLPPAAPIEPTPAPAPATPSTLQARLDEVLKAAQNPVQLRAYREAETRVALAGTVDLPSARKALAEYHAKFLQDLAIPWEERGNFKASLSEGVSEATQRRIGAAKDFMNRFVAGDRMNARSDWTAKELATVVKNTNGRANYASGLHTVNLYESDSIQTIIHEFAHTLENDSRVRKRAVNFLLKRRLSGEMPVHLGYRYEADEIAFRDHWADRGGNHYTGKVYKYFPQKRGTPEWEESVLRWIKNMTNSGGEGGPLTEIMSTGLERLYESPVNFAQRDPEFFRFIIETIQGKLEGSA